MFVYVSVNVRLRDPHYEVLTCRDGIQKIFGNSFYYGEYMGTAVIAVYQAVFYNDRLSREKGTLHFFVGYFVIFTNS